MFYIQWDKEDKMTIVTVQSLRVEKPLQYNVLTKEKNYTAGGQFFDWSENKIVDGFRVGHNGIDEFCIEDSIGRFIPFNFDNIDSLIDTLLSFRQDNDNYIKISHLKAEIRELENDAR